MERTDKSVQKRRMSRKNRVLMIVALSLLAAVILAAIFIPLGIRWSQGEVILSYGTVTVRRDLYVYWLSMSKYYYLSSDPEATDTPAYWNETTGSGLTRAEEARADADAWIRQMVFASSFFEADDSVLGAKTRDSLEEVYRRLLQYELNTEKKYNRAAKGIGFTYSTVRRALLYENEYYAYVGTLTDGDFAELRTLAAQQVELRSAAEKIDFVSLPTDGRLYARSGASSN